LKFIENVEQSGDKNTTAARPAVVFSRKKRNSAPRTLFLSIGLSAGCPASENLPGKKAY